MKKNLDMTEGKPISLLWAFTFPTLMGNLLNQVYSITDSIVVGRYLGQTALAAVGSTMPVILLLAALMIGINVGVGIIISRYFGQKNEELMREGLCEQPVSGAVPVGRDDGDGPDLLRYHPAVDGDPGGPPAGSHCLSGDQFHHHDLPLDVLFVFQCIPRVGGAARQRCTA